MQVTLNSEGANTRLVVNLPGVISKEDCPGIVEEIRRQILEQIRKLEG
ncbi:MAG: hypothetical protein LBO82_06570 [Synergistaceae bacterium]|nr:hypothetical protein [Synergistaceae bacterium]